MNRCLGYGTIYRLQLHFKVIGTKQKGTFNTIQGQH